MNPSAHDHFFWNALSGAQAQFATGTRSVRRLAPGFTPFMAAADPQRPDFAALAPYCRPGERLHCFEWKGAAPEGWRIEFEATLCRMVWSAGTPPDSEDDGVVQLDHSHLAQVLDLVERTQPGPFGPRMLELGDYVGCFAGGRLVALAGERLHAGAHREISAVCTDPDHRGRGLAQLLVRHLIRRQLRRHETPLLHVRLENTSAHRLYEQMGFREQRRVAVRAIEYQGGGAGR